MYDGSIAHAMSDWLYRAMNIREFRNGHAQQDLLPMMASHEADIGYFQTLCHELCMKLVRLIALGLKVGGGMRFHHIDWRETSLKGSTKKTLPRNEIILQGADQSPRFLMKKVARIGLLYAINLPRAPLAVPFA